MAERDTGFHPLDPDYSQGRAMAIGEANGLARMQMARDLRTVTLKPDDKAACEAT